MKFVTETERRTPVVEEVDVVVVGGGTAGMPAAVAAARNGARTALVERWGYVGGAAVGGMVLTVPENAGIWGIEKEFYGELEKLGGLAAADQGRNLGRWFILSAPLSKYLGDVYLQRAGVQAFYHTLFVDVLREGERIDAVVVESKSGRQAIRAKMVVDATGDADVACRAGAPCQKGNEKGEMLEVTMMYNAANADIEECRAQKKPGEQYPGRVSGIEFTLVNPGEVNCWGGSIKGDATDNRDLTRMEMALRAMLVEEWQNMRRYMPGFAQSYISCIAEQMGVRETRHLLAEYLLTLDDRKTARQFPDTVGKCWGFTVPYRALLPKQVSNLLVAGRCIGAANPDVIRIIPNCFTTGQAAGTAAALAARAGVGAREVDTSKLQAILREQNVCLGET